MEAGRPLLAALRVLNLSQSAGGWAGGRQRVATGSKWLLACGDCWNKLLAKRLQWLAASLHRTAVPSLSSGSSWYNSCATIVRIRRRSQRLCALHRAPAVQVRANACIALQCFVLSHTGVRVTAVHRAPAVQVGQVSLETMSMASMAQQCSLLHPMPSLPMPTCAICCSLPYLSLPLPSPSHAAPPRCSSYASTACAAHGAGAGMQHLVRYPRARRRRRSPPCACARCGCRCTQFSCRCGVQCRTGQGGGIPRPARVPGVADGYLQCTW